YIKRRERTRNIPIIFVTAISKEQHHVFRGYEAGAVDYVFKPYDPVVLRSKVQVFIELFRAGRALRASEALGRATFDDAPIGLARCSGASPRSSPSMEPRSSCPSGTTASRSCRPRRASTRRCGRRSSRPTTAR